MFWCAVHFISSNSFCYCRDKIALTLGPRALVLSVTYTPLVSPLAPPCEELADQEAKPFQSKISYETATPGMTIPLKNETAGWSKVLSSQPVGSCRSSPRHDSRRREMPELFQKVLVCYCTSFLNWFAWSRTGGTPTTTGWRNCPGRSCAAGNILPRGTYCWRWNDSSARKAKLKFMMGSQCASSSFFDWFAA